MSSDNAQLLSNTQAVSSDLAFGLKPSMVRSRQYRHSIAPSNKNTFSAGDQMIFYIPGGRRNTFLLSDQSYLRLTIKNTDATNFCNLESGYAVLNRQDIFHSSNLCESIQQLNVLATDLLDFSMNASDRQGESAILGTEDGVTNGMTAIRQGYKINANSSVTVCLPIMSGVIGTGCNKLLPIGMLNDDIRIEWTLASSVEGVVSNTAAVTYQVTYAELVVSILELSDEGMALVSQTMTNPLYIPGNSWRSYVSSLPASAGSFSFLVPARFASLKSLICCPRYETTTATAYSVSSRTNPNITAYNWRIGSAIVPQKQVNLINDATTSGYAEAFAEILKERHAIDSLINCTSVSAAYFNVAGNVNSAANGYKNAFSIHQELETVPHRSDVLASGVNTLSSQVFFEGSITTAPANTFTLNFYANYDHVLVLQDGILSVRF